MIIILFLHIACAILYGAGTIMWSDTNKKVAIIYLITTMLWSIMVGMDIAKLIL